MAEKGLDEANGAAEYLSLQLLQQDHIFCVCEGSENLISAAHRSLPLCGRDLMALSLLRRDDAAIDCPDSSPASTLYD
jgi:hypothetical protein